MLLAIAVLLIHPQLATTISLSADKAAIDSPAAVFSFDHLGRTF